MSVVFILFTMLVIKHFVFDFLYQPPYQWMNKGTYGHPGGILHSLQHILGTFLCLFIASVPIPNYYVLWTALAGEFLVHYHVDWVKMNFNKRRGWGPTTHQEYWVLLGIDQLFHYLTYIVIVWLVLDMYK